AGGIGQRRRAVEPASCTDAVGAAEIQAGNRTAPIAIAGSEAMMQTLSFHHGCVALAVGLVIGTMPDAGWAQASRGIETRCPPQCGGNYSSSRSGSSNQGGAARDAWLYESI